MMRRSQNAPQGPDAMATQGVALVLPAWPLQGESNFLSFSHRETVTEGRGR